MSARRRIAVVGGGLTGLAAAHRLLERAAGDDDVEIVLIEAGSRLGGSIATERTGGFLIEHGADSFLTEKPWAVGLCERLGIAGGLVGTREGERRTYVFHVNGLEPVPEGFLLLAPTDVRAVMESRLFSRRGKLRMALDLVLPRGRAEDESLAAFVRRRLGREVLERVAQPLAAGIYTGDAEKLSVAATMPRFRELERKHRSLILGLRAEARRGAAGGAGARYGLFAAPADGMGALIDALARRLPEGVLRLRVAVDGLARIDGTWRLRAGGATLPVDAVVLTTPAYVSATLLRPHDPALADELAAIPYASSATVTLGYRRAELPELRGFGFVMPAIARRPLLACTFASRKFPGRAPEGFDLLRGFVGGVLHPEMLDESDAQLTTIVRAELHGATRLRAIPVLSRVARHPRAMPQYEVGHLQRVAAIEAREAALRGVALAGAAYRGVGIPDCIRDGEAAADRVWERLTAAGAQRRTET